MTIYIDLIFFENIIMNSIIIYATSLIVKSKVKIIRLILSATIGAIYSIALYITNMKIYTSIFSKFVLSIVMMYVAFKPQKVKKLCKQTIIFYLTSFIFGGVALYLVYYLKPEEILIKNGMYVGEYVLKVIILGAIFACIIVKISINLIKSKIKCSYCKITIKLNEKEITTQAMIDTGNLVKEPITNAPVVIVESSLLEGIIPREILKNLDNILCGNLSNISQELQDIYISKLRCIPFSSLGKENGMLVGIKASEIIVENEDEIKVNKNIVLGIYDKSLTKKGEYRALIGTELA
mgnify:FL=1